MENELRQEYDLKSLRVRRLGCGRKSFYQLTVRLEPDGGDIFHIIKQNQAVFPKTPDQPSSNTGNNK